MQDFERVYASAINFLSYRPRSVSEVRIHLLKKFSQKRIPDGKKQDYLLQIEPAIEKLISQRFLNDLEFAKWWVESRVRNKPRSKFMLKLELQKKEIAPELIEQAFATEEVNDENAAKQIVLKKIKRYLHLSKPEIYQKLGGLLGRRGFKWEVIKRSIDEVLANEV